MATQTEMRTEDVIARECLVVRLRMLNRVVTNIYDDALRPLGPFFIKCMSRFADPSARDALAQRLRIEPDEVATTLAITDPAQSVRDDIARLRQAPGLPDTLVVSGLVYDVANGSVEQIVAPYKPAAET